MLSTSATPEAHLLASDESFWCHGCRLYVGVSPETLSSPQALNQGDLSCDNCGSSFVEEVMDSQAYFSPSTATSASHIVSQEMDLLEHPSEFHAQHSQDAQFPSANVESFTPAPHPGVSPSFSPETPTPPPQTSDTRSESSVSLNENIAMGLLNVVQQVVSHLQSTAGLGLSNTMPFSVYVHNGSSSSLPRLAHLSQLAGGSTSSSAYNQLLHNLLMGGSGNRGAPPASKEALQSLVAKKVQLKEISSNLQHDSLDCAVCKDEFSMESAVLPLPCAHLFCEDCIVPWLKKHNTCPVCREEIGASSSGSTSASEVVESLESMP